MSFLYAGDGQEALSVLAQETSTSIDIVLSDI